MEDQIYAFGQGRIFLRMHEEAKATKVNKII